MSEQVAGVLAFLAGVFLTMAMLALAIRIFRP